MEQQILNNYVIEYNNKSVVDKLENLVNIRYKGHYINIVFITATEELANEISKWSEIDSVELERKGILFQE